MNQPASAPAGVKRIVMQHCLAIACLFVLSFHAHAQQEPNATTWRYFDSSIVFQKNLGDIEQQVRQLAGKTITGKNYFAAARCYQYLVQIADLRNEDSFYFRNSAILDSVLQTKGIDPSLQLALHLLQAKRLNTYTSAYRGFDRSSYSWNDIPFNYALFENSQIDSIAQQHFEKAIQLGREVKPASIDDVLWLSYDPSIFFFSPSLTDVVISERIRAANKNYSHNEQYEDARKRWLPLSPDEFIAKLDSASLMKNREFDALVLYRQWLQIHRDDPAAYYYIETLVRKHLSGNDHSEGYLYDTDDIPNEEAYIQYLEQRLSSSYNTVKAHAVYQLCMIRFNQSLRYHPKSQPRWKSGGYVSFDTLYRYHAVKALQLFAQHKPMLDSFAYVKKALQHLEKFILSSTYDISIKDVAMPGEPVLAELEHKNVGTLYYRVVKRDSLDRNENDHDEWIKRWLKQPPVLQKEIAMPFSDDHNMHLSYLKIDALPTGKYVLLVSHLPFTDTTLQLASVLLDVSSIAIVNSDQKVFVLNRKTGLPWQGAEINATEIKEIEKGDEKSYTKEIHTKYTTNQQGYVLLAKKPVDKLVVRYKGDTLTQSIDVYNVKETDEAETMEDRVDGHVYTTKAHIYTDRAIYRPGQTVHFKAIFITANAKTGKEMLLTRNNLGTLGGKSVYDAWIKERKPVIYLVDAFDKGIDTITVKTNEFGSMSGSFRIPKSAATGDWEFDGTGFDIEYGGGSIKVEEYKRPAYEMTIAEPEKELYAKDTFHVTIKLRSFAGAELNNVKVKYSVRREGYMYDKFSDLSDRYQVDTILNTTAFTNAKGEIVVMVNDTTLANMPLADSVEWNYVYEISAESVDETGESHETNTSISVSTRPLVISANIDGPLDRSKKMLLPIRVSHPLTESLDKDVSIIIKKKEAGKPVSEESHPNECDLWIYPKQQLQQWFPYTNFDREEKEPVMKTVLEKTINTGKEKELLLDPSLFTPGSYQIEMTCRQNGRITGINVENFDVYDRKENKMPQRSLQFSHVVDDVLKPGNTIQYVHGNSETPVYAVYEVSYLSGKNRVRKDFFHTATKQPGISQWDWKIPADINSDVLLTHFFVWHNEVYRFQEKITVVRFTNEPEIVIEKFRKKMAPGDKTTFTVSVKSKDIKTVTELATTLYDATLDKLQEHSWNKPYPDESRLYESWEDQLYRINSKQLPYNNDQAGLNGSYGKRKPVWWLSNTDEDVFSTPLSDVYGWSGRVEINPGIGSLRGGSWKDVDFFVNGQIVKKWGGGIGLTGTLGGHFDMDSDRLTYAFSERISARVNGGFDFSLAAPTFKIGSGDIAITTAVPFLRINGKAVSGNMLRFTKDSKLKELIQPLIYLDGQPFTGDINSIDPALLKTGIVVKGQDAVALYGEKAAKGVLILSTTEYILLYPPDPPPPLRKNFNETAFFFPAIYADKDGLYRISFTMPESVTEWNWKMLAHTKDARFAYAEEKVVTQLPLMVQPNMPRVLYQGDRIVLKSRISNLDTMAIRGKLNCKVEDFITGEDLTKMVLTNTQQDFSVAARSNSSAGFEIRVPPNQLNPLRISVEGRSGNFSDGEEHVIPILSTGIFIKQYLPFAFNKDTAINIPSLPANTKPEGISLSMRPQPQAAILDALPYLSQYPHGCAEQVTNKIGSYLTATRIMRTNVNAREAFAKASAQPDTSDQTEKVLPGELEESLLPWLTLRNETTRRQEKLMEVLDTTRGERMISELLEYLYSLQKEEGGMSWFPQGKQDWYISNYVLRSFGQLHQAGWLDRENFNESAFEEFIKKLTRYCEDRFMNDRDTSLQLDYLYADSYWNDFFVYPPEITSRKKELLKKEWTRADRADLARQAMLIITTLRSFPVDDPLYEKAIAQLRSISQLAIRDDRNGIRWKAMSNSDDFNGSDEETIALLAEAFSLVKDQADIPPGIVKWLLNAKTDHHWVSTKATAAVIRTINKESQMVEPVQTVQSKIAGKTLTITNDPFRGSLQAYIETKTIPATVSLTKTHVNTASGFINWYYFSNTAPVNSNGVSMSKELSRWNEKENKWEIMREGVALQTGERIRVALTIQSPRALQYVYISDSRSAAFEPVDNSSGYEYGDAFSYYRSIRDAGFQFFATHIPSGKHTIYYEVKTAQQGTFTNGMAVLQCMYKPEVAAYSNGWAVEVR